jgi:hypothetical protein
VYDALGRTVKVYLPGSTPVYEPAYAENVYTPGVTTYLLRS